MPDLASVPRGKHGILIRRERIVRTVEEDHNLNERETKLIEKAKKGKFLGKKEFLKRMDAL